MTSINLPLEPLILSICSEGEPGPVLNDTGDDLALDYARLDADLLHQIAPDHVVSWLFCPAYDVYDIAQMLSTARFGGTYTAAAPDLPNTSVVTREIRACFPALDFRLFSPAELSGRAARYHDFVAKAKTMPILVEV
jgi:hypothetical protein